VKLGKKRRENSKRNYYIICPRVIKAITIIFLALDFFWEIKTAFSVAPNACLRST